jgi:hypothetical protein
MKYVGVVLAIAGAAIAGYWSMHPIDTGRMLGAAVGLVVLSYVSFHLGNGHRGDMFPDSSDDSTSVQRTYKRYTDRTGDSEPTFPMRGR